MEYIRLLSLLFWKKLHNENLDIMLHLCTVWNVDDTSYNLCIYWDISALCIIFLL